MRGLHGLSILRSRPTRNAKNRPVNLWIEFLAAHARHAFNAWAMLRRRVTSRKLPVIDSPTGHAKSTTQLSQRANNLSSTINGVLHVTSF